MDNIRRLEVFDRRCLRGNAGIRWSDRESIVEVRNLVLGTDSPNTLFQLVKLERPCRLGYVLRIANTRLSYHTLL